jgi:hypothetical protein
MQKIAIEIKASTSPKVSSRFWNSIETVKPDRTVLIAPVDREYPLSDQAMVMPLNVFLKQLSSEGKNNDQNAPNEK